MNIINSIKNVVSAMKSMPIQARAGLAAVGVAGLAAASVFAFTKISKKEEALPNIDDTRFIPDASILLKQYDYSCSNDKNYLLSQRDSINGVLTDQAELFKSKEDKTMSDTVDFNRAIKNNECLIKTIDSRIEHLKAEEKLAEVQKTHEKETAEQNVSKYAK